MKLIIAGSRGFEDFDSLERSVLVFLKKHRETGEPVEIVSGRARGVDRLGERFAERYGLKIIKMPADWDQYGKSAGYRRNSEMAEIATHCIIFWDGRSKGSKHMADLAEKKGLCYEVVDTVEFEEITLTVEAEKHEFYPYTNP